MGVFVGFIVAHFTEMYGLPQLLIFLLPAFGVSNDITLVIFIVLMFGCHLFMPGHHHRGNNNEH